MAKMPNRSRTRRPKLQKGAKRSRQPWTPDETRLARQMRAAGHSYEEIDWALRRRGGLTKWLPKGVDHGHNVGPIHVADNFLA
jgi:hypothetical protein